MTTRQDGFEVLWSLRHDLPAGTLKQYRFDSREGYRLPDLASHFRTYCDTLDSVPVGYTAVDMTSAAADGFRDGASSRDQEVADLRRQIASPSKVYLGGPVRADHWCLICGPSVDHGGLACPKTHAYSNN